MNIRNLIDFLPPIFKYNDTYKVEGKGFLERYLEICGSYLVDVITPDIDNILDIIEIDTTPKEYLNYLWEFLGEIPLANIFNIDKDKWDLYYDGTRDKEDLWIINNQRPLLLTEQNARDLIKYSLSLYKIRGTRLFFDVILRLYGLECMINTTTPSYQEVTPHFDKNYLDKDSLDIDYECGQVGTIDISLDDRKHELVFADINGVIIMGSLRSVLTGKSPYILPNTTDDGKLKYFDLEELVNSYNEYPGTIDFSNLKSLPEDVAIFVRLRLVLENFFDKFIPYNAKWSLKYNGITPNDGHRFDVLYEDPDNSIITPDQPSINLKIVQSSKWPRYDSRYQVSGDKENWVGDYHDDPIYTVTNPGTYYFKLLDMDPKDAIPVSVGSRMVGNTWTLDIKEDYIIYLNTQDGTGTITPLAKFGDTSVPTIVKDPLGRLTNLKPGETLKVDLAGEYEVLIADNPLVSATVYVYDNPISRAEAIVSIPYGVELILELTSYGSNGISTKTIGGPDSVERSVPIVAKGQGDQITVVDIVPWLRHPKDPSIILRGSDFIYDSNSVISIAVNDGESYEYTTPESLLASVDIESAKKYLNNLLADNNVNRSILITLSQANISNYYKPHSIEFSQEHSRQVYKYLHNPLFLNTLSYGTVSGNLNTPFFADTKQLNIIDNSNLAPIRPDVVVFGAILLDNTVPVYLQTYDPHNPTESDYTSDNFIKPPYYTGLVKLGGITGLPSTNGVNLSGADIKGLNGNTIRRPLVVMGATGESFGKYNITPIWFKDTTVLSNGLYISYPENDIRWSIKEYGKDSPLVIDKLDGTQVKVSRVYTYKLNNDSEDSSYALVNFKLVVGGVTYDDSKVGNIIIDNLGNTYNTRISYILDTVRYYVKMDNGVIDRVGYTGYIFSVKTLDSQEFTIMLNLVIDPEASDRNLVDFSMKPNTFRLPSNGKTAITMGIASRPYKFPTDTDEGIYIIKNQSEGTSYHQRVSEFTVEKPSISVFNATGKFATGEPPKDENDKVNTKTILFQVSKNSSKL